MNRDAQDTVTASARAFVQAARAMERWDLIELRDAFGLPEETPLVDLADLVARLHHLPHKTPDAVEDALRRSAARPWLERSQCWRTVAARLPAVVAFVSIQREVRYSTL